MSLELERPPQTDERREWADFWNKIFLLLGPETGLIVPTKTDTTRGSPGQKGRIIFNDDDGKLNVDDGTNWTLPDGTTT